MLATCFQRKSDNACGNFIKVPLCMARFQICKNGENKGVYLKN